jgi:hypothetical protein
MNLNLGCGKDIRKGYINIDCFYAEGVDKIIDLNETPYYFQNNSVEEIIMQDILEHLENITEIMYELIRICKDKAIIKIRVPHFKSPNAWGDITHIRPFSSKAFKLYDLNYKKDSLENKRFKLRRKKVEIMFPKIWHKIGIAKLINKNDFTRDVYERYFSGLIIPENVYFELEVLK